MHDELFYQAEYVLKKNHLMTCVTEKPNELFAVKEKLDQAGIVVKSAELVYVPKTPLEIEEDKMNSIARLIDILDEHDDVQKVWVNLA